MTIRRTDKEIIITLPASINTDDIQEMIDFMRYKEITSKSKAKQPDIKRLLKSVKQSRRNKSTRKLMN